MFTLDDAHTVEEIDAAEDLSPMLVEMDQPLGHLPRLISVRRLNALRETETG